MKIKNILTIILAFVIAFSAASCSKYIPAEQQTKATELYTEVSEEITDVQEKGITTFQKSENETKKSESNSTVASFSSKKTTKKSKALLNQAIKAIMDFEYKGYCDYFIEYDIFNKPETEIELILNTDYEDSCDPDLFPIDYNWYNNGVVNEDLLYKRIIQNNRAAGIKLTSDCDRIAKMVAFVAQYDINYLKENFPSFNFNIPLYHLDTVTVDTSDESWYYSLYGYDANRILVNFSSISSENFFRSTVSHEVFHLMNRGEVGLKNVYFAGSSVDYLDSVDRPLEQNFMNEWYVENASYEAFNDEMNPYSYEREKGFLDLIFASTDKDVDYYEKMAFGVNKSAAYDAFEEELRNANFVYSTLNAFDFACFYIDCVSEVDDFDSFEFSENCEIYATVNIMKNAYIRLLKEIYSGEITYYEACEEVDGLMDILHGHSGFTYEITDGDVIDDLNEIFHSYASKL